MGRTLPAMLACLTVGAAGMWVASNFRLKFEPVGGPVVPTTPNPTPPAADKFEPPVAVTHPPDKLPPHLLPKTDPNIQKAGGQFPASAVGAATLGLGATPEQIAAARTAIDASPFEITELLDGTQAEAVLYAGADLAGPILLRGGNLTLNFRFPNQADLKAKTAAASFKLQILATAEGSTKPVVADNLNADSTTATLALTGTEFAGRRKVTLTARWVDTAAPPADPIPTAFRLSPTRVDDRWEVLLPTDPPPVITKVYSGRYAVAQTSGFTLFPGFARVEVASRRVGAEHTFFLYSDAAARRTVQATPTVVSSRPLSSPGVTEYTLAWAEPVSGNAILLVRETSAGRTAHNTHAVPVSVAASTVFPKSIALDQGQLTPVVGGVDQAAVRPVGGTFLLATDTAKLSVRMDSPPASGKLLLFVNKLVRDFPAADDEQPFNSAGPVSFTVKFPTDGDHVVYVAYEAGGVVSPNPLAVSVRVRRGGLAVTRVSPTDFSTATDYRVRVAFNPENPVSPAAARAKGSYALALNGADVSASILSDPVPFDPMTNTATLQLSPTLAPGQYTLTVKAARRDGTGGVKDVYGNPLGGVFGEDGADATAVLVQPVGGTQPSVSAGVTLGTGPNVTFPEYTKFRTVTDGFNPSDRVETRVVRLYYTRDAHRVAQIVNRDVKSYNAAAVDVRRRAADRTRDDANLTQDERQRLERAAVVAAGEARAAETELRQLEAQLAAARNEAATARVQVSQREQQLTDARRELTRTEGGTNLRANDLILVQQDRVKDIQDAIGRTQALRASLPPNDPRIGELEQRENVLRRDERDAQRELDRLKQDAVNRADRGNDAQRQQVRALEDEVTKLRQVQATGTSVEQALQARIADARSRVQAKRTEEVRTNELALSKDREELRKREEQFRREVAAARADPDTYAPGKPESVDPVEQCSVSVIGEGLIQIRGPVKGLNVIRTMINQIDAPTGQVRVGVHTVQVNGERADRMDKVVANIQRYLDHSRFLTVQSAQMLRKAVTLVASRKADEVAHTLAPGCSRAEQEQKYLYSFFGRDFVEELRQLDSEFLRTGNKLLSLHSMDSTSLSAALFLLALAKNDIRHEILQEWQAQLQSKLPAAEMAFYTAGLACLDKCEAHCDKQFCVLSQNAKFTSFLGFFDAEVQGTDTLTPVQREFVRLAQIFKTRLVTELELKQRVMERTLLEDRLGDYLKESREAKQREDAARAELGKLQQAMIKSSAEAEKAVSALQGMLDVVVGLQSTAAENLKEYSGLQPAPPPVADPKRPRAKPSTISPLRYSLADPPTDGREVVPASAAVKLNLVTFKDQTEAKQLLANIRSFLGQFRYLGEGNKDTYEKVRKHIETALSDTGVLAEKDYNELRAGVGSLLDVVRRESEKARKALADITAGLRDKSADPIQVYGRYTALRDEFFLKLNVGRDHDLAEQISNVFSTVADPAFATLSKAATDYRASAQIAQLARRPLDEKKLLDMLVDEMEDKYIELLDGTRAHTANVDNYLKALATALDDDFNTQFYQPAFRKIRTLGTGWDVHLGQIESTTVLTNNRVLGKVQPAASMEFDLPRRSILIKEAMDGARAAVQDYGALLNDPVFLSMVKLYGGMPPSAQFGGASGGLPAVRNVLPGLPTSADEMILAQGGSPRRQFGTNLEALIPDPAIYKFETGTGYEIRPVISPDGQAVVFAFDYMYTTDLREPVRADEKHLGRVKRHFVHTDVQLTNFELREVSKYWVALKAARTGQGVQLLQDIPGVGALFRPAPSAGSSLQQNLIYTQAAIFPTLFDLMGLRYAPAVADIDPEFTKNDEFVVRGRRDYLRQFIFDYGASRVDDALRILYGERRQDLYRSQHTIPAVHPNGYQGPGLRQRDSHLQEGYDVQNAYPPTRYNPGMHAPLPADRSGRFDDPLGYPPPTLPNGGYTPPPPGVPYGAKPTTPPLREYGAKPLGTTVTRDPPPAGYTPLKAAAPTALPPARPSQPTVKAPGGQSAPLPTIPPPPAKADPLEVEPAPISAGQRGNPYQPR